MPLKAQGQEAKFSGDLDHTTLEEREGGLLGNHSLEASWATTQRSGHSGHALRQVTQPSAGPVSLPEMTREKIRLLLLSEVTARLCWRNQGLRGCRGQPHTAQGRQGPARASTAWPRTRRGTQCFELISIAAPAMNKCCGPGLDFSLLPGQELAP